MGHLFLGPGQFSVQVIIFCGPDILGAISVLEFTLGIFTLKKILDRAPHHPADTRWLFASSPGMAAAGPQPANNGHGQDLSCKLYKWEILGYSQAKICSVP